jgi:hypothetical protein
MSILVSPVGRDERRTERHAGVGEFPIREAILSPFRIGRGPIMISMSYDSFEL